MLEILLDQFMFGSLWNGGIFMFSAFAIIIHLFILPHDERHSVWKTVSFIMGFVVIFIAVGSPINIIARIQFSTHVIQMILLLFVAPPLLIWGCKQKLLDVVQEKYSKLVQGITNPKLSFIVFFVFLYSYHIPMLFDTARMDLYLNYFYLLALFFASILFWIPIVTRKLSGRNRMIYILLSFVFILPFFFAWLLAPENLYRTYTDMSSFIKAIELCLPPGEALSEEYYLLLIPFNPVYEQFKGGVIWLLSLFVIFSMAILLVKRSVKLSMKRSI